MSSALRRRAFAPIFLVAMLMVVTANTEPRCVPVDPGAPVCLTRADCDGLAHNDCEGEWACADAACVWSCEEPCAPSLSPVSPPALAQELEDKDFMLINVHVPYAGEVPGTDVHISYQDVSSIAAAIGPDLTTKVVIYCKSNGMASVVGPALRDLGYCHLRYLDGGMNAWVNAGFELAP